MYWTLLLIPTILSAIRMRRNVVQIGFFLLFVFFVVAVGLRERVGMDWSNYEAIYDSLAGTAPTLEDLTHEPAFYLINFIAHELDLGITFVNVAHALVFLGGLFYFAYKRCPDSFLALAVATPYLVIVIGMSGIRQAAAIGVFMFLLAVWNRVGTLAKISLLVIAAGFHSSAILLFVLVMLDRNRNVIKLFVVAIAVMGIGLYAMGGVHEYYVGSYVDENLHSPGAVFHSLLVVGPAATYVLLRRRFVEAGLDDPLIFRMSILALCMFPLLAVSSTGVDRFLLYFTPVQMYVFSGLRHVFKTSGVTVALAILNCTVLFIWLAFANNADAWTPYSSCLLAPMGCFQ